MSRLKHIIREIPLIANRNKIIARYLDIPAQKNHVNVFQYHPNRFGYTLVQNSPYNLGDSLGEVIINHLLSQKGIELNAKVSKTRHFYCVGTNIHGAYQDATIWGSGIYPPQSKTEYYLQKLSRRKLDIRAVRGPLTKQVLEEYGHHCPDVFGDPAVLMPLIYYPKIEKRYDYLVIPQFISEKEFRDTHPDLRMISMNTNDYKHVIDEIVSSDIVYTSSLHGIILAEAYGVPAIFFRSLPRYKDFKYLDYYYSTGRYEISIADSFEDSLLSQPQPLPNLSKLREGLLNSFPYDLWD